MCTTMGRTDRTGSKDTQTHYRMDMSATEQQRTSHAELGISRRGEKCFDIKVKTKGARALGCMLFEF